MSATCSVPVPARFTAYRTPSLSRSGAMALILRVLGAAGLLLSHIVLARGLGVEGFGEYSQAVALAQFLCVFGKLGLDNTSLRYVSEYLAKSETGKLQDFLRVSTRASILSSVTAMICVIATALTFQNTIGTRLAYCLMLAAVMIPLISVRQIQEASLRGVGLIFQSQISTTIWPLMLFAFAGIVRLSSSKTISPAVATLLHLVSIVFVSILVHTFLHRSKLDEGLESANESHPNQWLRPGKARRLKVRVEKETTTYRWQWTHTASAFLVFELLIALKSRIAVVMAGQLLGSEQAGLYAAMERFADVSILGSQSLGMVIAPQFAALFAAGRFADMRRLMARSQILGLAFAMIVAAGVACFGHYLFLLLGPGYREGWNVLLVLMMSTCIAAFASPAAYVLQMTGHERTMVIITAICAITNIVFSLLLTVIWPFGILGLAISQVLTVLVWTVAAQFCLRQHPAWQSTAHNREPVTSNIGGKVFP